MKIQSNISLAPYTSFGVGGRAEHFSLVKSHKDLTEALKCTLPNTRLWILGYGSNSLISDQGLPGMTICVQGGEISVENVLVTADAGVWWDDVVVAALSHNLWGIELLGEIPGSVGGGAFINIAAYGQSFGERVHWIEVWDRKTSRVKRLNSNSLSWSYKKSLFQEDEGKEYIILRVCFKLSRTKTTDLVYQKACDVADELKLDVNNLPHRRIIIHETRNRAGSLWDPKKSKTKHQTAGSFFRNPVLSKQQAEMLMKFDESGKSIKQLRQMNAVHGGDELRVSAAHVMLAAGYCRGQKWQYVQLNEQNVLKIEALEGACAQDIYSVVKEIQNTCRSQLGIELVPEARILGEFR